MSRGVDADVTNAIRKGVARVDGMSFGKAEKLYDPAGSQSG